MTGLNVIKLDEWYSNAEAIEVLSRRAGRPIDKNYPRTLARLGKIRSFGVGTRGKMYYRADVDSYTVSSKRGPKPKKANAA